MIHYVLHLVFKFPVHFGRLQEEGLLMSTTKAKAFGL